MPPQSDCTPALAPLQKVMLADSMANGGLGAHIEQVEIVFADDISHGDILSAWEATVKETEALRISFAFDDGCPTGWERVDSPPVPVQAEPPDCMQRWLERDRVTPILRPGEVPWRVTWFPVERRFIWTFHHALLDGRSMAQVLRQFLRRVETRDGKTLPLPSWQEPSAETRQSARESLRKTTGAWDGEGTHLPQAVAAKGFAAHKLGRAFANKLEARAAACDVTPTTILLQAWGQVLMEAAGSTAIFIEQVRSGPPTPGTAGFLMNTLPVLVKCMRGDSQMEDLRTLRQQLVGLRDIESVSFADYPREMLPALESPWNSVIMIERGTLRFMVEEENAFPCITSLDLHEYHGDTLAAAVYLRPDFLMVVEGPERERLLDRWAAILERMVGMESTC